MHSKRTQSKNNRFHAIATAHFSKKDFIFYKQRQINLLKAFFSIFLKIEYPEF